MMNRVDLLKDRVVDEVSSPLWERKRREIEMRTKVNLGVFHPINVETGSCLLAILNQIVD